MPDHTDPSRRQRREAYSASDSLVWLISPLGPLEPVCIDSHAKDLRVA